MPCPPVLFLIFNRPDYTKRVFERIREAQPEQLFIAADGPRPERPNDLPLCKAARSVIDQVDWPCEVKTLFREENLGFHQAVSGGITWFFSHVDFGIVLEDDCLPTLNFFRFCGELLVKYRDDSRIGMISGNNWGFRLYDPLLSYSFSRHGHIWGWASWKRAWEKYDATLQDLTADELDLIKTNVSENRIFADSWWHDATGAMREPYLSWDYLWGIVRYANNFLVIRPKVNMVANIGFGEMATNTRGQANRRYITTGQMQFPLVHPKIVVPDRVADKMLEEFKISSSQLRRTLIKVYKEFRRQKSRAQRILDQYLIRHK